MIGTGAAIGTGAGAAIGTRAGAAIGIGAGVTTFSAMSITSILCAELCADELEEAFGRVTSVLITGTVAGLGLLVGWGAGSLVAPLLGG
jgi:hypothetical protein